MNPDCTKLEPAGSQAGAFTGEAADSELAPSRKQLAEGARLLRWALAPRAFCGFSAFQQTRLPENGDTPG